MNSAKKSDEGKENDENENNADAEAAARSVFLRATNVLTQDQVREIAARNTIPVEVLNHFVINDWMRVVNQLTADGTISQEDVKANLKRKAEISREKAEKRELKRSKRDGATNAGRLPRLIAPGATARETRAEDDEASRREPPSDGPDERASQASPPVDARDGQEHAHGGLSRARVLRESGKGLMENAASKGGGLPTDVHRCQRRWTKLSRQVPGIFGELDSLVPAMRERGATARERWASDRLLAKQRGETLSDDDDVERVGRSSDVDSNSWDSKGVWCVAVDDELAKGIDEALEKHPIAYAAAAEYHYARGPARRIPRRTRTPSGVRTTRFRWPDSSTPTPTLPTRIPTRIPTPTPTPTPTPPTTRRMRTSPSLDVFAATNSTPRRSSSTRTPWSSSRCSCRFATRRVVPGSIQRRSGAGLGRSRRRFAPSARTGSNTGWGSSRGPSCSRRGPGRPLMETSSACVSPISF